MQPVIKIHFFEGISLFYAGEGIFFSVFFPDEFDKWF